VISLLAQRPRVTIGMIKGGSSDADDEKGSSSRVSINCGYSIVKFSLGNSFSIISIYNFYDGTRSLTFALLTI